MNKDTVWVLKNVSLAFLVALILIGVGASISLANPKSAPSENDARTVFDNVETELRNINIGKESDGFLDIDTAIENLID